MVLYNFKIIEPVMVVIKKYRDEKFSDLLSLRMEEPTKITNIVNFVMLS